LHYLTIIRSQAKGRWRAPETTSFRGREAAPGIRKAHVKTCWIPGSALTGSPGMTGLAPHASSPAQARPRTLLLRG